MLIGICDDEVIFREGLRKLCERCVSNISLIEIVCFSSGNQVLSYEHKVDVLFLDIHMKGIDGIQTAKKIREKDEDMIIIFLTGYKDYMSDGYYVKAFRYLIKPIEEKELTEVMADVMKELKKDENSGCGFIFHNRF